MAELLEATRAQQNVTEGTFDGASIYTWADLFENDPSHDQAWAYIFVGNIWIATYVNSGEVDPPLIESAINAVRAEHTGR